MVRGNLLSWLTVLVVEPWNQLRNHRNALHPYSNQPCSNQPYSNQPRNRNRHRSQQIPHRHQSDHVHRAVVDERIDAKLLLSNSPNGYLRCVR